MLSEMLQTLSVQPLWLEQMHNRAQSGYSTEQQPKFKQQSGFYQAIMQVTMCMMCICVCVIFPKLPGAFSACSVYLFLSKCPVIFWVSLSLTCRQMNMWANRNIWSIHYSRRPRASLMACWPVSQLAWECLGIPQRCCEVKSGPLWLGHWTLQAGPRGH